MALKYVMIAKDGEGNVVEQEFPKTNAGEQAWGEAVRDYWRNNYSVEIRLEDR